MSLSEEAAGAARRLTGDTSRPLIRGTGALAGPRGLIGAEATIGQQLSALHRSTCPGYWD